MLSIYIVRLDFEEVYKTVGLTADDLSNGLKVVLCILHFLYLLVSLIIDIGRTPKNRTKIFKKM